MVPSSLSGKRRHYRGKILYIGDEEGERGREWFDVTVELNGTRTLRAKCEIDGSAVHNFRVLRDVVFTLDGRWRPIDAFVRITVNDEFMGSSWFRFGEREVECEAFTAGEGRLSQKVAVDIWPRSFGSHPVVCDIWHLGGWDWSSGERKQRWPCIMSSPLSSGASGPMIFRYSFEAEYIGNEQVTVAAGTFDTKHFTFPSHGSEDWEPEHVWFTGENLLFVKIRWDHLKTTYELVEFEEEYF
jgi:hypothetical protein